MSIRDILSWVQFINTCTVNDEDQDSPGLEPTMAFIHGACLVFLDSLGAGEMFYICLTVIIYSSVDN